MDALQQKMSECHGITISVVLVNIHCTSAMKRRDVIMTFTKKKTICHALDCMCQHFGEVQMLAAMQAGAHKVIMCS